MSAVQSLVSSLSDGLFSKSSRASCIASLPLDRLLTIQHIEISDKFSVPDGMFRQEDRQKATLLIFNGKLAKKF
jgi:hypothetical protein